MTIFLVNLGNTNNAACNGKIVPLVLPFWNMWNCFTLRWVRIFSTYPHWLVGSSVSDTFIMLYYIRPYIIKVKTVCGFCFFQSHKKVCKSRHQNFATKCANHWKGDKTRTWWHDDSAGQGGHGKRARKLTDPKSLKNENIISFHF